MSVVIHFSTSLEGIVSVSTLMAELLTMGTQSLLIRVYLAVVCGFSLFFNHL